MKKSTLLLSMLLFVAMSFIAMAQTTYYTAANGAPETLTNWWTGIGGTGTHPANFTTAGDIFVVQSPHVMTMAAVWSVTGTITINNGGTLARGTLALTCGGLVINGSMTNGRGTSTTVNGNVSGTGTIATGGTARVFNVKGNWTFSGTAATASITLNMNGTGAQTLSGVLGTGTPTNSSVVINKTSGTVTLGSNFTITGSTTSAFILTAGTFDPSTFLLTSTTRTFTAGILRVGGAAWANNYSGAITQPALGTIEYYAAGPQTVNNVAYPGHLSISGAGTKTWTFTAARVITGNLSVASGATLTTVGNFTLGVTGTTSVTGTLNLGGTSAKTFTGNVTINSGGVWNETGVAAINYAGNLQNDGTSFTANTGVHTFSGIGKTIGGVNVIAIPSLTISGTTTNNGTLTVSTALAGASTLTNGATGNLNFGGSSITPTLTATAAGNTVNYYGASQTVKATIYDNLIINQSTGNATLGGNATVNNILTLTAGNLVVTDPQVLTMGASATTVGVGDVTGIVTRTTLVAGTSYTFGNQYTTITFQNTGILPTVISVKIIIGSAPAWKTGAIQRYYDIIRTGGVSSYATLNLHYRDAELNGNTEINLVNWAKELPGGTNEELGRSNYDLTEKWFGQSDFPVSTWHANTVFGERQLTLGDPSGTSTTTWTGSTNGVWDLAGNWTGGIIPTITIAAIIPSTTNKPTISGGSQTVKSIEIQTGGELNLSSSAILTISGSSGAWINSGGTLNANASTVVFTNAAATIAGTTDFNNVTINSGAKLTIGTDAIIRINGVFANSGTFVANDNENTVEYNGAGQTVLNPNGTTAGYYNLILSGSGTKTMPGTALNVSGDFTMSGTAEATAGAAITVVGNITLDAGTTFNASTFTHNVTGNWINNGGTFTAGTSTINMNGSSAQTIGGSGTNAFTTLKCNNAAGILLGAAADITTLTIADVTPNSVFSDGGFAVATATTLNLNSGTYNCTASTFPWGTFNAGTGTVNYSLAGAQSVAAKTYNNLTLSGSGEKTVNCTAIGGNLTLSGTATATTAAALTISGNLAVGTGTIFVNGNIDTWTLSVTGTTSVTGTLNLGGTSAKTFTGNVTINSGGIWNETGVAAINYAGNLQNDGTSFTANTGVHTFSGIGKTIGGVNVIAIPSLTISGTTTNNGTLTVSTALAGASTLTNGATGNLNFGGSSITPTLTATAAGNTVNYYGASQTVKATIYDNLIINQSTGNATLGGNATVNNILTLTAGNLVVTDPQVLTMGASATTVGVGDVTGIVTRTTLVAGTSYTFGNQYTTITFQNTGILPTVISVKIIIGSAPAWKTGAIQRVYDIIQNGASGSYGTINLHYLDAELNGNGENLLVVWDAHLPTPPGDVDEHGRSNYNTSDNWIGTSHFEISYFPTSFGTANWTLANSARSSVTWNGSVDADWTDIINWTPNVVPSDLTDVIIPDASTTTNDPELDPAIIIGRLTIENGGILNAAAASTFTVTGGVGAWVNNGGTFNANTSTVIFSNVAATLAGPTDFYNVTVNSGAELQLQSNSTVRISGTLTNDGVFEADDNENTVEYNGAGQTVLNPNGTTAGYYNLILSGSGTKTMPGTALNVSGDFTMSGTAEATAGAAITVVGNITLDAGTTFNASTFTHNVTGNWINNGGTFTAGTSTINMNGSSAQTIGGSGNNTFSTLKCNNAAGILLGAAADITTLTIADVTPNSVFSDGGFAVATATTLNLNSGTYNCTASTFPWGTFNAGTGTVNYSLAGAQSVAAKTYNNLTLSGSGEKTLTGATIGATGTLDLQGIATTTGTTPTYTTGATLKYSGSSAQTTGSELSSSITNLTINNTSGITLSGSTTVDNVLTFTNGKITTGVNNLIIDSSGSVTGAGLGKYVYGNLQKVFGTGVQVFTFNMGDASNYTPMVLSFADVTTGGNIIATTTGSEHTDIANAGLIISKTVNRFWTFTNNGVVFTTYDVTMNFVPSDIDVDATTSSFIVSKKDGGTWTHPTVGTQTATSIQATWLTTMSDFTVGEPSIAVTAIGDIIGTAKVGEILSAGSVTPSGATVSYQWQIADAVDGLYTDILSATAFTYLLIEGDVSKFIKVVATGTGNYFGTITSAATTAIEVLPVELTSFTASSNNRNVELVWKTATEVNSNKFEVERNNGKEWMKVGSIGASGTSNAPKEYSYVDKIKSAVSGNIAYRLKMIDNNGKFEYSNITEVKIIPTIYSLEQNYPNPFNPETKIQYSLPVNAKVTLKVYDIIGREVATIVNEQQTAGYYEQKFDGYKFSSGVYFYRIVAEAGGKVAFTSIKKMIMLK